MTRRIRHIHARPSEWVKVHRDGRSSGGGGGGGDPAGFLGCLILLIIGMAVMGSCSAVVCFPGPSQPPVQHSVPDIEHCDSPPAPIRVSIPLPNRKA